MPTYHVTWLIEVDADTPVEAAREARRIQLDPSNEATSFMIWDYTNDKDIEVDLADETPTS